MSINGYTERRMGDLADGDIFQLEWQGPEWEYRGEGWYDAPGGYCGGPWHRAGYQHAWVVVKVSEQEDGQGAEAFELERVEAEAPKGWGSVETSTEESDQEAGTKQAVLFAGLGCLPGQLDLFKTDGEG